MSGGVNEPPSGFDHFSAAVEKQVVLYGGIFGNLWKEKNNLSSRVHLFDPYQETWCEATTRGPAPPPGLYNGACASSGHNFYVFGGCDGEVHHSSLHQLDTSTLCWSILSTTTGHMKKSGSKMISYNDQLLLFGGHGIPSGSTQPGAEFVRDTRFTGCRGWTNELHTFSLKEGE